MKLSMLYTLIIPLVFIMNSNYLCKSFNKFIKILSVVLGISLVVYVLVVFFNVPLPHTQYNPVNIHKEFTGFRYDLYPFLLLDPTYRGGILYRFYGIYDEPGVVGTICAVVLVANKYNFKNIFLIPIFIAGLFSFSLFFYVITIFYYIISLKRSNIVFTVILSVFIFYVLRNITGVDELVFNRFMVEDGVWLGNSRDKEGYGQWFSHFMRTSDFYWGLGEGANLLHNTGGASYKDIIVNYGLLMFLLYIISLIVLIFRCSKNVRGFILLLFVILGYIFQRPFITDVFMSISFLYLLYSANNKDEGSKAVANIHGYELHFSK